MARNSECLHTARLGTTRPLMIAGPRSSTLEGGKRKVKKRNREDKKLVHSKKKVWVRFAFKRHFGGLEEKKCMCIERVKCMWERETCVKGDTQCNTLQHTAMHYHAWALGVLSNTLQHTRCKSWTHEVPCNALQHQHCNTPQLTTTHCNAHTHAPHELHTQYRPGRNTLTPCNILPHTAPQCNTPQHTHTRT